MSADDVRLAEALESIDARLAGFTKFLEDYAKHNFNQDEEPTRIVIPAQPGWVIEWEPGHGPIQDPIIAWDVTDLPFPITVDGPERNIGDTGHITNLG